MKYSATFTLFTPNFTTKLLFRHFQLVSLASSDIDYSQNKPFIETHESLTKLFYSHRTYENTYHYVIKKMNSYQVFKF